MAEVAAVKGRQERPSPQTQNGREDPAILTSRNAAQRIKNQSRMITGIGTPRSQRAIERMLETPTFKKSMPQQRISAEVSSALSAECRDARMPDRRKTSTKRGETERWSQHLDLAIRTRTCLDIARRRPDERGRTQQGNNNAYCQDNEISWVEWTRSARADDLTDRFTSVFSRLTMSNIRPGSPLMWIHFTMVYVFIGWTCWLTVEYYKEYIVIRQAYLVNVGSRY